MNIIYYAQYISYKVCVYYEQFRPTVPWRLHLNPPPSILTCISIYTTQVIRKLRRDAGSGSTTNIRTIPTTVKGPPEDLFLNLMPRPKKSSKDYRPVALISHIINRTPRAALLASQIIHEGLHLPGLKYQAHIRLEDAVLHLRHRTYTPGHIEPHHSGAFFTI